MVVVGGGGVENVFQMSKIESYHKHLSFSVVSNLLTRSALQSIILDRLASYLLHMYSSSTAPSLNSGFLIRQLTYCQSYFHVFLYSPKMERQQHTPVS